MKIVIVGYPKTGKSTLAAKLAGDSIPCRSTDEVMNLEWSAASLAVSKWFDEPGPWIIEGVAVPRALRKWAQANPGKPPPVDKVIHLTRVYQQLSSGQIAMGKGIDSVLGELGRWLSQVEVERIH